MALPYRLIHKDNLEMSAFHWLATLAFAPSLAQAHAGHHHEGLWQLDPWVLIPLSLGTCLYGLGLLRLWKRRPSPLRMIAFAAALLCLFLALIWPLEALSGQSFAAHMLQHMLLLSVAAPLLVAARPLPVILAALPGRARRLLIRGFARHSFGVWSLITRPGIAFALHALIIWAWHAPAAFQWALRNDTVHFMEHLCFLLSAHLFWWSMLHRGGSSLQRYGANTLWVLSTLIHTGFLGAVLTFARYPLYTYYAEQAQTVGLLWGLSPLEDQQLGGTLMWVLGAGPYLLAGLVLVLLCLRALERRASH